MSPTLPPRDVWTEDAHLSDAALNAIADGQLALVGDDAAQHSESCAACATRLADLALLAEETSRALAPIAAERASTARRFPFALVLVALVLAGVGAAPSFADRSIPALAYATSLPKLVPQIAHAASVIASAIASGPLGAALPFAVFVVLALSGALIARSSRQRGVLS